MIRPIFALALGMALSCTAHAESIPAKGAHDARMKKVTYNRDDVVKVVGHYGYSTDIELAPGESVVDIAIGDSLAWEIAPSANHLFVKPREDNAVTNMTVVTNKRVYQFALDARRSSSPGDRSMYFQVRFDFPEDRIAEAKAMEQQRIADAKARMVDSAFAKSNLPINWNYYACGTREIRPSEIFDDGRFTYMRFPGGQEIPAIFMINADGSESIVNGAMRDDRYVVQVVARQLVLRKGQSVACMQNRSYNHYGVATPTGTASPDVERLLRDTPTPSRAPTPTPAPTKTEAPVPTVQVQGIHASPARPTLMGAPHVSE
jgi:type IV secretion system protein VirB9